MQFNSQEKEMKKKYSIGVKIQFKDGRVPMEFDKVTNTDWLDGFIHLSIEVEPAKYDKEDRLVKEAELNTVASFSQDIVSSIVDM